MTNSETKYQTAKAKMVTAFLSLLEEKDFLSISVKEVCKLADVHRSTFYAHYDTTLDLLEDARKYCIDSFFEEFQSTEKPRRESDDGQDNFISMDNLVPYLGFIKQHRKMYEIFVSNRYFKLDELYDGLIEQVAKPAYRKSGGTKEVYGIYYSRFYISGIEAIVKEWIRRGFAESEEELANLIASTVPHKDSL